MIRSAVRRKVAAAVGVGFALALLLAAPASAVPPGGPGADTPGTSAEVSPSSLSPGDKISFTLRGFPTGETVNIKIDDGEVCGEAAIHGACVVYKKKIGSGSTVGSFRLPKDLEEVAHTLRFLASEEIEGSGGGINGFTLRSPEFTIVAANQESQPESSQPASQSVEQKASKAPKTKKASEAPKTKKANSDDAAIVTPAPVTTVVTGAGLSVAQAIGVGGGAVGLAALVGGLTAWWRRGGLG